MAILKITIHYKGNQFKKYIKLTDDELSENSTIYILITNKHKRYSNYHFIYDIIDETVIVPSTSYNSKESSIITINLLKTNKLFKVNPHCIYLLGLPFNKALKLNVVVPF